jgi:hypothetical protein
MSGKRTIVFTASDSNPDCSPREPPTIRIKQRPKHGSVSVAVEEGYTNYPKDSQLAPCNLQKREVTQIYYTSNERFLGKDTVSLEWFYSGGGYGSGVITINVR